MAKLVAENHKVFLLRYDLYDFAINSADNKMKKIKMLGITKQNRDFSQALDVNRIAMCANNEDYGFKLKINWTEL